MGWGGRHASQEFFGISSPPSFSLSSWKLTAVLLNQLALVLFCFWEVLGWFAATWSRCAGTKCQNLRADGRSIWVWSGGRLWGINSEAFFGGVGNSPFCASETWIATLPLSIKQNFISWSNAMRCLAPTISFSVPGKETILARGRNPHGCSGGWQSRHTGNPGGRFSLGIKGIKS